MTTSSIKTVFDITILHIKITILNQIAENISF